MNRLAPIQSTAGFHLSGRPIVFQPPIKVRKKKSAFKTKAGKSGKIMFDMAGVEEELAREAFRLASAKLPIKTHFIKKDL